MSAPNRKIDLPSYYCPVPYVFGGDSSCDHDYDPNPTSKSDYGATWTCTKCGCKVTCDVGD